VTLLPFLPGSRKASEGHGASGWRPVFLALAVTAVAGRGAAHAQEDEGAGLPPVHDFPAAVSFLSTLLFPIKIVQDEARLRDFVVSEQFARARRALGDRRAVDVLFRRALELSWNNTGEALAISMLATLEHRTLGIKLPLIGPLLWIPLTGEFEDEFRERVACLPERLYADTPPEGDRDKLQHFFGSAFLTVLSESADASDALGVFVEVEEEVFVVGGSRDERDIRANRQGQRFALALMNDRETLPSPYLSGGAGKEEP
jgi:hypothetical protein